MNSDWVNPRLGEGGKSLTVLCTSRVTLTFTAPLVHRCPYRAEVDEGSVEITWTTAGWTLELHALAAWLAGFTGDAISHEDITGDICAHLSDLPGIADVQVTTRWTTAGGEVSCRAVLREPHHPQGA